VRTATAYIKISRDPDVITPNPPRRGRSKDGQGRPRNGVYLQTFKRFEIKRYIRNGVVLGTFRFPRFERTFQSPLVNDYNQHLAGGWYWRYREDGSLRGKNEFNNETILERLIAGRKPLGGFLFWDDQREKKEIFLQNLANLNLSYTSIRERDTEYFAVSRKGRLGELFNFDYFINDYIALENGSGCRILGPHAHLARFLGSTAGNNLESYLSFDHLHPVSTFDFIITGLILGYPVENTYALLLAKHPASRR
jgi:hypothetical protein